MLNELEIRKEIARLEYEESSYPNYAKLADLYLIREQMQKGEPEVYAQRYSLAASPMQELVGNYGNSDFLLSIEGKYPASVWRIMDELMSTLQTVNERAYNTVMRKIENL